MLLSIKHISEFKIEAKDGSIGHIYGFLFNDQDWIVRYLVIDTGIWLTGRRVLITTSAIGKPHGQINVLPVELTREQIRHSPDIDTEKPVSRQQELRLFKHYNLAPYWGSTFGPAVNTYAPFIPDASAMVAHDLSADMHNQKEDDPHLRSTKEVLNYRIHAQDGEIGHVEDFILHLDDWKIRYIVVNTRNWLPGRKVIISPDWIKKISWEDSEVVVNVAKDIIKQSPDFDPTQPVNREYETRFYDYYGRPKYWL